MNQKNNKPKKMKNDQEENDIPDKGSPFKKVKKYNINQKIYFNTA